jgi:LPXTG-site transpeptidase (sortase) family protein
MRKKIGTILILASAFILTFIYYPIFSVYFGTSSVKIQPQGSYISIPKIKATAQVVKEVNPWNENEYREALKKGVARASGFDNFYFAHSSLPPWEMTRTNIPFLRLGELAQGDQIILIENGVNKDFEVIEKVEVWPWEVQVLENNTDKLILQTCTPIGTDLKRLLIFAKAIE